MDENCEKIKAVLDELSTSDLTASARLIAVLHALGIEDPAELRRMTGLGESGCRKARNQLKEHRHSGAPPECAATLERHQSADRHQSAPLECGSRVPTRARIETPSGLLLTEEEEKKERTPLTPQGGNVLTVSNWNQQFADQHSGGVIQNPDGSIDLVNGTRAMWLNQFGGDETRLNLAIIQAAGEVQPRSRQPLRLQIERSLARIAGQKHDSDQRYKSRIQANPPKQAAAAEFSRLLAERQARKAAEGAA